MSFGVLDESFDASMFGVALIVASIHKLGDHAVM